MTIAGVPEKNSSTWIPVPDSTLPAPTALCITLPSASLSYKPCSTALGSPAFDVYKLHVSVAEAAAAPEQRAEEQGVAEKKQYAVEWKQQIACGLEMQQQAHAPACQR